MRGRDWSFPTYLKSGKGTEFSVDFEEGRHTTRKGDPPVTLQEVLLPVLFQRLEHSQNDLLIGSSLEGYRLSFVVEAWQRRARTRELVGSNGRRDETQRRLTKSEVQDNLDSSTTSINGSVHSGSSIERRGLTTREKGASQRRKERESSTRLDSHEHPLLRELEPSEPRRVLRVPQILVSGHPPRLPVHEHHRELLVRSVEHVRHELVDGFRVVDRRQRFREDASVYEGDNRISTKRERLRERGETH